MCGGASRAGGPPPDDSPRGLQKMRPAESPCDEKVLPMAFRLGKPVRDGEERRRMRPEAHVARLDDDVLGEVAPRLEAAAPSYNAVGRTPDRRCRHGGGAGRRRP